MSQGTIQNENGNGGQLIDIDQEMRKAQIDMKQAGGSASGPGGGSSGGGGPAQQASEVEYFLDPGIGMGIKGKAATVVAGALVDANVNKNGFVMGGGGKNASKFTGGKMDFSMTAMPTDYSTRKMMGKTANKQTVGLQSKVEGTTYTVANASGAHKSSYSDKIGAPTGASAVSAMPGVVAGATHAAHQRMMSLENLKNNPSDARIIEDIMKFGGNQSETYLNQQNDYRKDMMTKQMSVSVKARQDTLSVPTPPTANKSS